MRYVQMVLLHISATETTSNSVGNCYQDNHNDCKFWLCDQDNQDKQVEQDKNDNQDKQDLVRIRKTRIRKWMKVEAKFTGLSGSSQCDATILGSSQLHRNLTEQSTAERPHRTVNCIETPQNSLLQINPREHSTADKHHRIFNYRETPQNSQLHRN